MTADPGCANPPNPSPYLDVGGYTRYDVNISSEGCAAGAVVTITEAVTGAAGATITQTVTVPGFDAATATFSLPATAATPTATPAAAAAATATPTTAPAAAPPLPRRGPGGGHRHRPGGSPAASATAIPAGAPRASDGQHLGAQPAHVQAAFLATHGPAAPARWAAEHEAELARPAP